MKYDIFKFERELVLNAALKMISEGQLKKMGLPEIAHYSGLAEGTVRKIFQSTEFILNELSRYITESISANIETATNTTVDFKEQFKLIWQSMFRYYVQNPQVLALMQSPGDMHIPEIEIIISIVNFFRKNEDSFSGKIEPELLAQIFHGNIISAAKISLQNSQTNQRENFGFMPEMLWIGLKEQGILYSREHRLSSD